LEVLEVRRAVDDLETRLAEAAEQAAQRARAPGAAVTLQRAGARRRRAAGTLCALVVVVAAAGIAVARGGLDLPTVQPSTDRGRELPWRPLMAKEWGATVPDERPLDPVLAAAQGEQAGRPWRLTVYPSIHQPAGQPAEKDVCYILEWFAQAEQEPRWQAHGTCTPEQQTTTALAAAGPDPGAIAVIGRAPPTAVRVRLELRGHQPVETATVNTGHPLLGRFYVAFVPPSAYLERLVALDQDGRQVGQAAGLGDLARARTPAGYPPTGPVTVVARASSSRSGTLEAVAWPTRYGYCLDVHSVRGGGSSGCSSPGTTDSVLAPQVQCSQSQRLGERPVKQTLVVGGVPRATRTVRLQVAGKRLEVPARDAGEGLGRAFFLAELPLAKWPSSVRVTALDASGATLGAWNLRGCG
jgi:hypothetical protein